MTDVDHALYFEFRDKRRQFRLSLRGHGMRFELKYDLRNPARWRRPWSEHYAAVAC